MFRRTIQFAGAATLAAGFGVFAFAGSAFAAATIQSLKLTGPNTITIVFSQPVYTSPGDYTDFTGSFAGETVTAVNGSGSNTITLTLSGSVGSNATGYVTVGTNVQDVGDGQYFNSATWNIIPAIGPAFTSFSISSNSSNGAFAGTNDTLTVSFSTNESVNIISMTIAGHPVSVSGGAMGPFTASYTMQSGDVQQTVPVTITIADNSNNQTSASFTYSGAGTNGGTTVVAAGAPVISSITSNANTTGVLTNGNSITFTLTPLSPEPNARVTGSYNGVPLSWATTNGGTNYIATYVVAAGQSSQPVPLQISGVTITDQNGNVSAAASGYDVQKTISVTGAAVAATTTDNSTLLAQIQALQSQLAALQTQTAGGASANNSTSANRAAGYQFNNFLGVGSQNADVTALQERLTADGYYSGPITGYFGTLTEAGVESFQAANGIDTKGYVGPSTRAALNAGK
ncbi:MAG TPA: peptidoglycan-binding domain-containing protein [Candidatus Paceibacterota bacterium]|nr:peptidoglycan-binding domain-containing protein [Candidatus Paceibacterota bacterium]